jgi:hypothetical protein
MQYHRMINFHPLHSYELFTVSKNCTVLCGISSYEPPSRVSTPLENITLPTSPTPVLICKYDMPQFSSAVMLADKRMPESPLSQLLVWLFRYTSPAATSPDLMLL